MPLEFVVVFAPLLGALIAGLFQRFIGDKVAMAITTGLMFLAAACALVVFKEAAFDQVKRTTDIARWISIGGFEGNWALKIDTLSATMLVVVTSVSSLVHLYSIGYMADDPHRARFFSYLSFFTFSMLMLVTSSNFLQLFFGWEGVGVASYLLIGFWYQKRSANDAAIKAFVTNRVGDFGFALGIMAIFLVFGSIEFDTVFSMVPEKAGQMLQIGAWSVNAIELIGILLFIGAMGKSAQFILHVWLPDAMEGPTPVSALIHAATMVTAGVFLICRCSPIYEYAPNSAMIITMLGAFTAIFAATVGLAQNDIKRVIAYSTCSQLGYMFFAAGIGAYQAAMFHLFTHAFFKALLFLGAGSVIHGMHHEQDMRRMGGLSKLMPITWLLMMVGTIALTGIGIPGTPVGFAGFFSKDAIIESAFAAGSHGGFAPTFAFWIGVVAAFLTSIYSWRVVFMTFHGRARADQHTMHHVHESPSVMLIPLYVLAAGAVLAGVVFAQYFIGHHQEEFWNGAIFTLPTNHVLHEAHNVPTWVKWAPFVVTMAGLAIAAFVYVMNDGLGEKIAKGQGPIHAFLSNKWYIDELYNFVFVKGARALGDLFWKGGDQKVIDGLGPNGFAAATWFSARKLVKLQSGFVYHYAFMMLTAAVVIGAFAIWRYLQGSA
jgi:NADH-quinone oxidoreductase subunit L